MCLYSKLIRNKRYQTTIKNGGLIPAVNDERQLYAPIKCRKCLECRKQRGRDWSIRLFEEVKQNKGGIFITLTFNKESYAKINSMSIEKKDKDGNEYTVNINDLEGYEKDNAIATKAVRLFTERYRKATGKQPRRWLVTELGHNGTERIHLHGIIWSKVSREKLKELWGYGFVWDGYNEIQGSVNYVNDTTIKYLTKYLTKIDTKHKNYTSIVLASKGIGGKYDGEFNIYKGEKTNESYTTGTGHKVALPSYYRNKIYSDDEKERLWTAKLDKNIRYVCGEIARTDKEYYELLEYHQKRANQLGYGCKNDWNRITAQEERKIYLQKRELGT
ncbi:MAG: putative replication initiation protein [Microviridae sp.]|nr:MAG: putative replication initiation protein [Microviridae sp.]